MEVIMQAYIHRLYIIAVQKPADIGKTPFNTVFIADFVQPCLVNITNSHNLAVRYLRILLNVAFADDAVAYNAYSDFIHIHHQSFLTYLRIMYPCR